MRLRLRSDVPLALTFSGGVDSGSIAALAAAQQSAPIRCYTVDYHTEQDPSEETVIAREVAGHLGFEWHYVHFDYHSRLLAELAQAYAYYDQPCSRISLVYSDGLYRAIKPQGRQDMPRLLNRAKDLIEGARKPIILAGQGIKHGNAHEEFRAFVEKSGIPVATTLLGIGVLTGYRADELFTGYIGDERTHLRGLVLAGLSWLRPMLRSRAVSPYLRLPLPQAYAETIVQSARAAQPSPAVLDEVLAAAADLAAEAEEAGVRSALDLKMLVTLRYSSSDSNFRMPDISGLAAQVEVRSPFLDHRMVEFASRVPDRFKVANVFSAARNKYLPKKYYERLVPPRYAWSRKKGMGWNLRWDRSIARDPNFATAFAEAWEAMDRIGIDTRQFRAAWRNYVADIQAGAEFSGHSKMMMNGLMLGAWLRMRPEIQVSRP